jgi:hypothetical protein
VKHRLLIATGALFLVLAVVLSAFAIALLRIHSYGVYGSLTGWGVFFLVTAVVTALAGVILIRRERRRRG